MRTERKASQRRMEPRSVCILHPLAAGSENETCGALDLFNVELGPQRHERGPRSQGEGGGETIPNATLSPPK